MQALTTVSHVLDAAVPVPAPNGYFQKIVPDYALLFFDHLFSEYLALKHRITEQDTLALLDSLHEKRTRSELTWSDTYTFDLALIDERTLENLIRRLTTRGRVIGPAHHLVPHRRLRRTARAGHDQSYGRKEPGTKANG